jgi:hypothetical protein
MIRNEKGQVIIFVAIMFMVLMFFFALVVDVAQLIQSRQRAQGAADFAALAGATVQAEGLNEIARLNQEIKEEYFRDLECMESNGPSDACPFPRIEGEYHGRLFEGETREEALFKALSHYSGYYNTPPPPDLGLIGRPEEQVYINFTYAEAAWVAARNVAYANGIYNAYIDAEIWAGHDSLEENEAILEEITAMEGDFIQDMTGLYSDDSYRLPPLSEEGNYLIRRMGPRMRFCLHYKVNGQWTYEHGLLTPEETKLWLERKNPEEEIGWTTHFCIWVSESSRKARMFGKGLLDIETPPLVALAQAVAEGGKIDFENIDNYYPSLVPVNISLEPPNRLSDFYTSEEIGRILH